MGIWRTFYEHDIRANLWSIAGVGIFGAIFLLGAVTRAGISDREISPWLWDQYALRAAQHGNLDALISVAIPYMAFYSWGFLIPYSAISVALSLFNDGKPEWAMIDRLELSTRKIFVSAGCCILFVMFLRSEIAFLRALPFFDGWKDWLIFLGIGTSSFLIFAGIQGIREQLKKIKVEVTAQSDTFCRCPHCGHQWTTRPSIQSLIRERPGDSEYSERSNECL